MKALDKIYVNIPGDYWHPGIESEKVDTDTEYIRKDALLEWAERMKSICKGAEPIVKAYQTVIDKLNSMYYGTKRKTTATKES